MEDTRPPHRIKFSHGRRRRSGSGMRYIRQSHSKLQHSKYFFGDPTERFLNGFIVDLRSSRKSRQHSTLEMQTTETDSEMKHTLFVGDLSLFCDDGCLSSLFTPFGSVTNSQIRRGRRGDSLLYGFVEFASKDSAQTAMNALDGKKFMGRTIR